MNTFVASVNKPTTARTTNGMKAFNKTGSACLDLFGSIGAMRGKSALPLFVKAYAEDSELALRIMLWSRDVRGGAGEREHFRAVLNYLEKHNTEDALRLLVRTPELGRWDDVLVFNETPTFGAAVDMIKDALNKRNGLAAKWMPRKGKLAAKLRVALGMSPKQYRKTLVGLTNVVETQMCAGKWDNINFEHIPSLAAARYKRALKKHVPAAFETYTAKAVKGEAKVNASAVYPYDVLKGLIGSYYGQSNMSKAELDHVRAQWAALPNYMNDGLVLPLVDVSGSMGSMVPGASVSCMQVAIGLGLYCADKNTGPFKDMFLTFSSTPELLHLKGDIVTKINQMSSSSWGMSTDLHKALERVLSHATKNNVPAKDMPTMLLIMSDMQFNSCVSFDDNARQMIARKYEAAGYEVPQIVFWNLNDKGNKPVQTGDAGTALISGFSPAILKAVLAADTSNFTPEGIMLKTVMVPRYDC